MNDSQGADEAYDSFVLERTFNVKPERVFAAYEDSTTRAKWGPPPGDEMEYSRDEFRVGGTDEYRCGPAGDLRMAGTTSYLDIVVNERIVFAETVSTEGSMLAYQLVSWRLEEVPEGTKVTVLVHVTSNVGAWMLAAARDGRSISLTNLANYLRAPDHP